MNLETLPLALALGLVLGAPAASWAQGQPTNMSRTKVDFNKDVLPILQKSCFSCHAPELSAKPSMLPDPVLMKRQEGEVGDAQDALTMGAKFPFPDDSAPRKQLDHMEKKLRHNQMPPEIQKKLGLGASLSDAERQLLLDWITQQRTGTPN
jgi:mono/diheme cytochrome c family protein